jgi:hypothetical protein
VLRTDELLGRSVPSGNEGCRERRLQVARTMAEARHGRPRLGLLCVEKTQEENVCD